MIIEEKDLEVGVLPVNRIIHGDALSVLKKFPSESVDCVITSPPYWSMRSYPETEKIWGGDPNCEHEWNEKNYCVKCGAWQGQLGLEPSPELYVSHLIEIFREVKRVLKPHGNVFVVIDDTYSQSGKGYGSIDPKYPKGRNNIDKIPPSRFKFGLPQKTLCLVPEMFTIRMVYDLGFILRQKLIWAKKVLIYKEMETIGNAMPECLDPETPVIIRENCLIKQKTLEYIYQNRHRLNEIEILTPSGFKKIRYVWETYKEAVEFEAGKVMKIVCSLDHRFPISHDRRRKAVHVVPVSQIRMKGRNDYLLFKPIREFIEPKYVELDLVKWAVEHNKPYVVIGVARKIKPRGTCSKPSWKELNEKYGYKVVRYVNGYAGRLIYLMRQDYTPVKVVLGEGVDYRGCLISKEGARIHKDRVPAIIPLDYEFGKFIGLYVAEGTYNDGSNYMKLTFHIDEKELHKFVKEFLYKRFNTETKEIIEGNSLSVVFGNAILKDVLTWIVQGKGKERKLNIDFILNTPEEFRKGILDGYIEGDGSTKGRVGFVAGTCSKTLAENISLLCSSIGIVTSIQERRQHDKRTGKTYIGHYVWTQYIRYRKDKEGGFKQILPRNLRKIGKRRMIDIEVDGGLFIIGTGIVTHNSVKDRNTHTFEFVYHFTKKPKYYYDQLRLPYKDSTIERAKYPMNGAMGGRYQVPWEKRDGVTDIDEWRFRVLGLQNEKISNTVQLTLDGKISNSEEQKNQRNSKFLESDMQTASPGGRLVRLLAEGKEDEVTLVRKAIDDVNAYLKRKLKESGLTVKQLAEMIGIKETTLAHYFRTDMSGAAIPPKSIWEAMKPILGLDDYEKHVKEEYKSILPSPHPEGANAPDVIQINVEPLKDSHYAPFPTKLVEFLIKVGCPEQVCKKCGKPVSVKKENRVEIKYNIKSIWDISPATTGNPNIPSARGMRDKILNSPYLTDKEKQEALKALEQTLYEFLEGKIINFRVRIRGEKPAQGNSEKLSGRARELQERGFYITKVPISSKNNWTDCGCGAGFEPAIVLDPFLGSGTTALVALQMGRRFVGIELNREYCLIALERIKPHLTQQRLEVFE